MNLHKLSAMIVCMLAILAVGCKIALAENIKAESLTEPISIDGKLDEAAWQQAKASPAFVLLKSKAVGNAPAKTFFRILADRDAVYLGIHCEEPKMGAVQCNASATERDNMSIFGDDHIEIFLDPEGTGANFYQFAVTIGNVQWDAYYIEGGGTSGGFYSSLWQSAIYKGKDSWTVEVRIPLSALYKTTSKQFVENWRINVARQRFSETELTTWAPLNSGFFEATRFNHIAKMPKKIPKFDLAITDMKVLVNSVDERGYTGELVIKSLASSEASGNLLLTMQDNAGLKILDKKPVKISAGEGALLINPMTFKTQGKMLATLMLVSDKGEMICGIRYPLNIEYSPLTVEISEPFYANCIFPDQDIKTIEGTVTVNLPSDKLQKAQTVVALNGPGCSGEKKILMLRDNNAHFSLKADNLAVGDYTVDFAVISSGTNIASKSVSLRKLKAPEGNYVYIDRNRNLVVNGKPVFLRSWYGGPGWLMSEQLTKQYGNKYNSAFVNFGDGRVDISPYGICPSESPFVVKDVEPSKEMYAVMKAIIDKNKGNTNFLCWYPADEPECSGQSPVYLRHMYNFIKKHDPYHPVMIVSREPEKFVGCADILNPHPRISTIIADGKRPVNSGCMQAMARMVKVIISDGKGKIAAWSNPHAFCYSNIPEENYPDFAECSCHFYTALVNGCTGFTPYIYNDHFNSWDLRLGVDFIYESMYQLEEFFLSGGANLPVKADLSENEVNVMVKKVAGKILVIAVNLNDKKTTANFECEGLKDISRLDGFREKAVVPVVNGKFKLDFSRYQTHILTYPKMGENLKTVETLIEEIEAKKKEALTKGNILSSFGVDDIVWDVSDTYMMGICMYPRMLVNGITDQIGWRDVFSKAPARVEMAFPNKIPRFRKAKIYTASVEDLEFFIWKFGEWQKVGEVKGNKDSVITLDFAEELSTVKIKILMPKVHPGTKAELCEIELYN